jgi:hypothetical protein
MMPLASSNDLILAGIQDILQALRNPTLSSPLDPLTDSHIDTLNFLSELVTGPRPRTGACTTSEGGCSVTSEGGAPNSSQHTSRPKSTHSGSAPRC